MNTPGGGGYFSEQPLNKIKWYFRFIRDHILIGLIFALRRKPIGFFAVEFGPIKNNIALKLVRLILNRSKIICARNESSFYWLKSNSKNIIKKLVSDGVLVSTPAGSTAYNLSVHGPILSLNSKKISIAPISAFRPRRWAGKIVSDKSKVVITNLNPKKRPISAVADNVEVRNAKKIIIKVQTKIKFNLLYDKINEAITANNYN